MELTHVMRETMSQFAPNAENQEDAIQAAVAAGERLIVGLGIGSGSVSPEKLRNAAIGVWSVHYEAALEAGFIVTSVCRGDLLKIGATEEQVRALTGQDMQTIAKGMEHNYVVYDGGFWDDLTHAVNERLTEKGLPLINFSDSPNE